MRTYIDAGKRQHAANQLQRRTIWSKYSLVFLPKGVSLSWACHSRAWMNICMRSVEQCDLFGIGHNAAPGKVIQILLSQMKNNLKSYSSLVNSCKSAWASGWGNDSAVWYSILYSSRSFTTAFILEIPGVKFVWIIMKGNLWLLIWDGYKKSGHQKRVANI
jgi:hypothetical protein